MRRMINRYKKDLLMDTHKVDNTHYTCVFMLLRGVSSVTVEYFTVANSSVSVTNVS